MSRPGPGRRPSRVADASRAWYYQAYGLLVQSQVELPELSPAAPGKADLRVVLGAIGEPRPRRPWVGYRVRVAAGQVWLHDDEVGGFRIRRDEVLVAPLAGARPNILRLALLGPVLAILLQLRGLLVLHGSAVEAGGRAAVFAGDTGSGKSTTAGALAREGAVPLVDDVVAVDLSHGAPMVLRGAPYLRLMPESLLALGEEPADLPRLRLDHEKRLKHHRDGGATHPVPLGALYLLEVAASIVVTPLAPADALAEILRQSYCADLLPKRATAAHFSRCAAVAAAVPVRRLGRPQALGRLAQLAAAVRDDLAAAAR